MPRGERQSALSFDLFSRIFTLGQSSGVKRKHAQVVTCELVFKPAGFILPIASGTFGTLIKMIDDDPTVRRGCFPTRNQDNRNFRSSLGRI